MKILQEDSVLIEYRNQNCPKKERGKGERKKGNIYRVIHTLTCTHVEVTFKLARLMKNWNSMQKLYGFKGTRYKTYGVSTFGGFRNFQTHFQQVCRWTCNWKVRCFRCHELRESPCTFRISSIVRVWECLIDGKNSMTNTCPRDETTLIHWYTIYRDLWPRNDRKQERRFKTIINLFDFWQGSTSWQTEVPISSMQSP